MTTMIVVEGGEDKRRDFIIPKIHGIPQRMVDHTISLKKTLKTS